MLERKDRGLKMEELTVKWNIKEKHVLIYCVTTQKTLTDVEGC